jgi:hypothetical protein
LFVQSSFKWFFINTIRLCINVIFINIITAAYFFKLLVFDRPNAMLPTWIQPCPKINDGWFVHLTYFFFVFRLTFVQFSLYIYERWAKMQKCECDICWTLTHWDYLLVKPVAAHVFFLMIRSNNLPCFKTSGINKKKNHLWEWQMNVQFFSI